MQGKKQLQAMILNTSNSVVIATVSVNINISKELLIRWLSCYVYTSKRLNIYAKKSVLTTTRSINFSLS